MNKTIEIRVPRKLITEVVPRFERFCGDIVTLENGMWTDVFVDDEGYLYTPTNDHELIDYLKSKEEANIVSLKDGTVALKTVTQDDCCLLLEWSAEVSIYNRVFEQMFGTPLSFYDFLNRIAFLNLHDSHSFIIKANDKEVGIVNLNICGETNDGYIDLKIYKPNLLNDNESKRMLKMVLDYIKKTHKINIINSLVIKQDIYVIKMLKAYGFKENDKKNTEYNNSNEQLFSLNNKI